MSDKLPDPRVNFAAFLDAALDVAIKSMPVENIPESLILASAERLLRFVELKAPRFIIEKERRLLAKRVTALPTYCPEYDELNRDYPC